MSKMSDLEAENRILREIIKAQGQDMNVTSPQKINSRMPIHAMNESERQLIQRGINLGRKAELDLNADYLAPMMDKLYAVNACIHGIGYTLRGFYPNGLPSARDEKSKHARDMMEQFADDLGERLNKLATAYDKFINASGIPKEAFGFSLDTFYIYRDYIGKYQRGEDQNGLQLIELLKDQTNIEKAALAIRRANARMRNETLDVVLEAKELNEGGMTWDAACVLLDKKYHYAEGTTEQYIKRARRQQLLD